MEREGLEVLLKKLCRVYIFLFILIFIDGCYDDHTILKTKESVPIEIKGNIKYEYKIQPYDRVMIYLYKYPDLSANNLTSAGNNNDMYHDDMRGTMIDGNGKLSLPLLGRVKLAGLTQTQASKMLEKKYSEFVKDPSVVVQVVNKKVYILGEVKSSKTITIDRDIIPIYEAIAKAGGFTDDAQRDNIIILSHNDKGKSILRRVDLSTFQRAALSNIILKPGDLVYVPPSGWKEYRLTTDNYISVLKTISQLASPYLTLRNVFNWD